MGCCRHFFAFSELWGFGFGLKAQEGWALKRAPKKKNKKLERRLVVMGKGGAIPLTPTSCCLGLVQCFAWLVQWVVVFLGGTEWVILYDCVNGCANFLLPQKALGDRVGFLD